MQHGTFINTNTVSLCEDYGPEKEPMSFYYGPKRTDVSNYASDIACDVLFFSPSHHPPSTYDSRSNSYVEGWER